MKRRSSSFICFLKWNAKQLLSITPPFVPSLFALCADFLHLKYAPKQYPFCCVYCSQVYPDAHKKGAHFPSSSQQTILSDDFATFSIDESTTIYKLHLKKKANFDFGNCFLLFVGRLFATRDDHIVCIVLYIWWYCREEKNRRRKGTC